MLSCGKSVLPTMCAAQEGGLLAFTKDCQACCPLVWWQLPPGLGRGWDDFPFCPPMTCTWVKGISSQVPGSALVPGCLASLLRPLFLPITISSCFSISFLFYKDHPESASPEEASWLEWFFFPYTLGSFLTLTRSFIHSSDIY